MQPDKPHDDDWDSTPERADEQEDSSPSGERRRAVVAAVDRRIVTEALRQLESIDFDDPDWRVEPLPAFPVNVPEVELEEPVDVEADC